MERLKKLIKEVLSTPPKKNCSCGCNSCDNTGNQGVVLNEINNKKMNKSTLKQIIKEEISKALKENVNESKLSRKDLEELKKNGDRIKLSDGSIVYAVEQDMNGMAGEPVSYIEFYNEVGLPIKYKYFSNKLTRKDKSELEAWMNRINDENSRQAHQWAR